MTGGVIRDSPAKFATVKNEFCIVFDRFTEIKEIEDDGSVAIEQLMHSLKFQSLSEIAEMSPLDSVDVIGVVHVVGPVG
jgi:hypothetical protein